MPKIKDLLAEPKKVHEKPVIMTPDELAEYLGVSKWTLQTWRSNGRGPKYIHVNNVKKYYRLDDVLEWMTQRTLRSTSDKGGAQ